jgi:hypothetical protein
MGTNGFYGETENIRRRQNENSDVLQAVSVLIDLDPRLILQKANGLMYWEP